MARRVRRSQNVSFNPNLAAEKKHLTASEWMVVASVPLLMIGAIRVIAIYYTLAFVLVIVGGYFLWSLFDSRKEKPKLHPWATIQYLLIVSIATVVYYALF